MIRRPPRSTQSRSSAASDVYKRQMYNPAKNTITKPEDLVGKTVGVQVGTTGEASAKLIIGVKVNSYPDIQLATQDLENGRIDAVANDYPVCVFYASTHPALKVFSTTSIAGQDLTQLYGIAMRLEDKQLKAAVDQALQDLVKDGTYDTIYAKWFGSCLLYTSPSPRD